MKLYFAPIDGVTGRIYRNAFTKFFVSPDKYFAPFISPCHNPKLKGKEIRELLPENNENMLQIDFSVSQPVSDTVWLPECF